MGTVQISSGIVTSTSGIVTYYGDGSKLTGITAVGSGVVVQDDGSPIGTAATLNFGTNLAVTLSSGVATINASGAGGDSYWQKTSVGIHTLSNVGIGTTNPITSLTVSGGIFVTGIITATDFNSASDINLKENVKKIDNPIDKIIKIDGVRFDWKSDNKPSMGVIAQNIEKVLPELVSGEENKTVNYNGIIGLLIECVKNQQEQIDELNRRLDEMS